MKQLIFVFFVTLFFTYTIPVSAETYLCADGGNGVGWCGERGGCPIGQICLSDILGTTCRTVDQAPIAARCANADESTGKKCGDWQTDDKCGSTDGGCQQGYRCDVTHNWVGMMTGAQCVVDATKCGSATEPPKRCLNTPGCGFCADPQEYCTVNGGLATCSKISGQCGYTDAVPPDKCGVYVYENNQYKCKVDGIEVSNYVDCAWVQGKCCPRGDMCTDDTGQAPGCGVLKPINSSGPRLVCDINGQIHTTGFNNCSANPSTPNTCCYGIACPALEPLDCSEKTAVATHECNCASGLRQIAPLSYCCGYVYKTGCYATQAEADAAKNGGGGGGGTPEETEPSVEPFTIFQGPTSETFKKLNPLGAGGIFGVDAATASQFSSPGGIISRVLRFAFPIAGLILFVMLVWAGFEILSQASTGKSIQQGSQRATAAIIGFVLLFASYFIMQVVEIIFGITIL